MSGSRWLLATLYRAFGRLPESWRHFIVGRTSPAHRVGTAAIVRHGDQLLLVRHSYRPGWCLPGGMLGWSEHPDQTVVREIREETGLETVVVAEPYLYWLGNPRRVELVYELRLAEGVEPSVASPRSAEIDEVGWFRDGDRSGCSDKTLDMLAWADHVREGRRRQGANLD